MTPDRGDDALLGDVSGTPRIVRYQRVPLSSVLQNLSSPAEIPASNYMGKTHNVRLPSPPLRGGDGRRTRVVGRGRPFSEKPNDPPGKEIVQLLSRLPEKSCNTLSLAGGSDAVAAGEGFSHG